MDAIVVAGGAARRMGGADKALLEVGGRRLIDRVLDALGDADRIVVVGSRRPVAREVEWTLEDPPGGGPARALRAGLERVRSRSVMVAAIDHPFYAADSFRRLAAATRGHDGAIAVDAEGRDQYLVGVYVTDRLRDALAGAGSLKGAVARLDLARVTEVRASFDIDTPTDLAEAQRHVR